MVLRPQGLSFPLMKRNKNLGLESISLKNEADPAHKTKLARFPHSNSGFVGCSFKLHFSALIASMPLAFELKPCSRSGFALILSLPQSSETLLCSVLQYCSVR